MSGLFGFVGSIRESRGKFWGECDSPIRFARTEFWCKAIVKVLIFLSKLGS